MNTKRTAMHRHTQRRQRTVKRFKLTNKYRGLIARQYSTHYNEVSYTLTL